MTRHVAACLAVCLAACNGGVPTTHGGGDAPLGGLHDAGSIYRDAGGSSHQDAGLPSGHDAGTFTGVDSGTAPPPPPGGCTSDIVPAPTTVGCMASTLSCLGACTDNTCADTCLMADPTCADCLDQGYVACANAAGCQAQWDALTCCVDGCADPSSAACMTTCASQESAYETCAGAVTTCDASGDVCFPAG